MPSKIVDLSARSTIIRDEPFHVHFWECSPREFLNFLKSPRKTLAAMGIEIPTRCRIETTIENHDWLEEHTKGFTASNGTIVCNTGGVMSLGVFTESSVMVTINRLSENSEKNCCTRRLKNKQK